MQNEIEFRASSALPVNGKPSWYGQYRIGERCPWRTAMSDYGTICYTSPEAAVTGAKVYAEQREARENGL